MAAHEPIDRQLAVEIVHVLRRHGLIGGDAEVFRNRLVVPIAARRGTAAEPTIPPCLFEAIERRLVGGENQKAAMEFGFTSKLVAEHVQRLTNLNTTWSAVPRTPPSQ